jgi:hypothetical protein
MQSDRITVPQFVVKLTARGFQVVESATGARVIGHADSGCRFLGEEPVFASRWAAQQVADDLNADDAR